MEGLTHFSDVVTMTTWHGMSSARASSRRASGATSEGFGKDELWLSPTAASLSLNCDRCPPTTRCLRRSSGCRPRGPSRCRLVGVCRNSDQFAAAGHPSPTQSARIERNGSDSLLRRQRPGKALRPGSRQRQCSSAAQNQSYRDEPPLCYRGCLGPCPACTRRRLHGGRARSRAEKAQRRSCCLDPRGTHG